MNLSFIRNGISWFPSFSALYNHTVIPTSIYVIMNSSESSQQHVLPNPTTTQPFISKFRKFTIHTLSLLVLFTAIYLGFTRTNYFKVHFLKYSLTSPPPPFHAIGSLFSPPKTSFFALPLCAMDGPLSFRWWV